MAASLRGSTNTSATTLENICERIRGEYLEMPGLCLTKPQVQRRWSLSAAIAQAALSRLVDGGFLRKTRVGYALAARVIAGLSDSH